MEIGLALQGGFGILGNLIVEYIQLLVIVSYGALKLACGNTLPATYAFVIVYYGLTVYQ